jgi:plastocyanin
MTPLLLLAAALAHAGEIRVTVVDAEQKPVPDAIVWVDGVAGKPEAPAEPAAMDQIKQEFVPRVLPVVVGTKVKFPNKDNIQHHIYSFSKAKKFEVPLYKGETAEPVTMDVTGVIKLGCNIHDWMLGYIVVLPNAFYAKTGADGKATLKNVPTGKFKVLAWTERLKGDPADTAVEAASGTKPTAVTLAPKLSAPKKAKKSAITY